MRQLIWTHSQEENKLNTSFAESQMKSQQLSSVIPVLKKYRKEGQQDEKKLWIIKTKIKRIQYILHPYTS